MGVDVVLPDNARFLQGSIQGKPAAMEQGMKKTSRVSRRSFVSLITGAVAVVVTTSPAKGQEVVRTGITDSDPDDLAFYGRGEGHYVADADSGPNADQAYRGASPQRQGLTDTDVAPNSDHVTPARRGGLTDTDDGPNADRASYGRGRDNGFTDSDLTDGPGRGFSGATDADSSDRAGHGRGLGSYRNR